MPLSLPRACLIACLAAGGTAPPAPAAEWQRTYLEPAIQAWMGAVALLAEEAESEERSAECRGDGECKGDCPACRDKAHRKHDREHAGRGMVHPHRHHGWMHGPSGPRRMHPSGAPPHGPLGPARPEGPRADALTMLQDISQRLIRIERMLAGRDRAPTAAGGARRGPGEERGPAAMSSEARDAMRETMKARTARMKQAKETWDRASPAEREAMKKRWEARPQEGREPAAEGRARMEQARQRFQEMVQRIERLEAEVERLRKAAESKD